MMTPRLPSRRFSRHALWCGLILLLSVVIATFIAGCGGGGLAFTGGGFPIGRSRVAGRIVDAANPATNLAGVQMTLFSTLAANDTRILRATTDANGEFNFDNVPTGEFSAAIQLTMEPQDSSRRSQSITFQAYNGRTATVIGALPLQSFDISQGRSLTVTPSLSTLPPGSSFRYTAQVLDANGAVLPVTPTIVLSDDLGTLGTGGLFTATTTGTATVTAIWYNNLRTTATVIVNANANPPPPAPPVREEVTD